MLSFLSFSFSLFFFSFPLFLSCSSFLIQLTWVFRVHVYGILGFIRNAVAASTERAYLQNFGAWVNFRVRSGVPVILQRGSDGMTNVWHLFDYAAYAFATKKLRSATTESHLSVIKFSHRISRGFERDTTHPVIASALKGAARSHAYMGNQATMRRPVSWAMLLAGETFIPAWRNGGRVLWLALCALVCFLTRASEMFAETRSRIHETYCLWWADVAFFRGRVQLGGAQWSTDDRAENRFRGSKGDQLRKRVFFSRVRARPPRPVGAGGGAVDLMIELMSCYLFLPSSVPLVEYGMAEVVVVTNCPC